MKSRVWIMQVTELNTVTSIMALQVLPFIIKMEFTSRFRVQ